MVTSRVPARRARSWPSSVRRPTKDVSAEPAGGSDRRPVAIDRPWRVDESRSYVGGPGIDRSIRMHGYVPSWVNDPMAGPRATPMVDAVGTEAEQGDVEGNDRAMVDLGGRPPR